MTFSVSSMSFGAIVRTLSRAVVGAAAAVMLLSLDRASRDVAGAPRLLRGSRPPPPHCGSLQRQASRVMIPASFTPRAQTMATAGSYEVYAVRYASHARRASENFLGGDPHD